MLVIQQQQARSRQDHHSPLLPLLTCVLLARAEDCFRRAKQIRSSRARAGRINPEHHD
jgi:hypothetical protein